eukprot:8513333-Pyramimonas_sp.AAC.1
MRGTAGTRVCGLLADHRNADLKTLAGCHRRGSRQTRCSVANRKKWAAASSTGVDHFRRVFEQLCAAINCQQFQIKPYSLTRGGHIVPVSYTHLTLPTILLV